MIGPPPGARAAARPTCARPASRAAPGAMRRDVVRAAPRTPAGVTALVEARVLDGRRRPAPRRCGAARDTPSPCERTWRASGAGGRSASIWPRAGDHGRRRRDARRRRAAQAPAASDDRARRRPTRAADPHAATTRRPRALDGAHLRARQRRSAPRRRAAAASASTRRSHVDAARRRDRARRRARAGFAAGSAARSAPRVEPLGAQPLRRRGARPARRCRRLAVVEARLEHAAHVRSSTSMPRLLAQRRRQRRKAREARAAERERAALVLAPLATGEHARRGRRRLAAERAAVDEQDRAPGAAPARARRRSRSRRRRPPARRACGGSVTARSAASRCGSSVVHVGDDARGRRPSRSAPSGSC